MSPDLKPGLVFEWSYVVPERATVPNLYQDTAFCREMPDVLATGYMVGMMELACVNGIMPYVDWPREQSLGVHVSFSHLAATPPGMRLTIRGEVIEVEGRRVKFRVEAWDGIDKITEGVHERIIIQPEKFNARLAEKKAKLAQ
ncbi:thioesterase family protein [Noviherbaspirillum massiliense]|uniref:thioesterase family protein n=1 Tax=Noviherbaspirillum massiliense TaxID=1465823 RepID=UPI0002E6274E|nr:thioesterase family protein [Noviherbaspirillum massiliense]